MKDSNIPEQLKDHMNWDMLVVGKTVEKLEFFMRNFKILDFFEIFEKVRKRERGIERVVKEKVI